MVESHHTVSTLKTCATTFLIVLCLAGPVRSEDSLLPDRKLTPGKIARRDTDRHRVTEEMERQVFSRYHIPWRRRSEFKIDHLIPIALGGADNVENLWPQSLSVRPYSPLRKELLTQRLLAEIAEGKLTLAQAQKEIAEDWISCFVDHLGMVFLQ